jgi:hypothetical protein
MFYAGHMYACGPLCATVGCLDLPVSPAVLRLCLIQQLCITKQQQVHAGKSCSVYGGQGTFK